MIIGLGVLILAVVIFIYWQNLNPSAPSLVSDSSAGAPLEMQQISAGQSILAVLEQLRRLKIDTTVYQDPVLHSLVDFTQATSSEPVGRPDPFLPVGNSNTVVPTGGTPKK